MPPDNLSKRELDALRLLTQGMKNREIGQRLQLSTLTVSSYLRSIYNKLDVTSRLQAMRYALDHDLL